MIKVSPSKLIGSLRLPPSKSHTMRAIYFGSMGKGKTRIENFLESPDSYAMMRAMENFGAKFEVNGSQLTIMGTGGKLSRCENVIDAGNSGQVLRFVGGLASLVDSYTVITGDHSIRQSRPVYPLLSAIRQLRGFATSSRLDDKAPIIVRGKVEPGVATLSGEDSQPVSALLMALSFLEGETKLFVENAGEKPWIDLTLSWIKRLGGEITHKDYGNYTIKGGLAIDGFYAQIPSDLSSFAFPLVAAVITKSTLTFENIDLSDVQGDKKIVDILMSMGAQFDVDEVKKTVTTLPHKGLQGILIDVNDCIDALPILAVAGVFAEGKTEIVGGGIARKKESDRIAAITIELSKMGAVIEEREDGIVIEGGGLKGANLFSHLDHRIAMAMIVAALGATSESYLENTTCIQKSYPSFIHDMQKVGGSLCF